MHEIFRVSFESKCICYISAIYKHDYVIERIGPCTGFFWRHENIPYLVTNRHCVTGRDEFNCPIGSTGRIPTHLQVYFPQEQEKIGTDAHIYKSCAIEVALYDDGQPTWFEHATGKTIDIAAIALDQPYPVKVHCVNDREQIKDWMIEAGSDCFIVGYPEGLGGPEGTPIWKRGSIASEPELDYKETPCFLCDSATRPGLSGSPVFGKAVGQFGPEGRRLEVSVSRPQFFGYWPIFLGIYSGRYGDETDGFQLGRVWKATALQELFDSKTIATNPNIVECSRE